MSTHWIELKLMFLAVLTGLVPSAISWLYVPYNLLIKFPW